MHITLYCKSNYYFLEYRMPAHRTLPFDVALALRLIRPAGTIVAIADELAVAPSQVHAGLGRLRRAALLRPTGRETNVRALGEFVLYGVRYAFPARRGPITLGVPTAHSALPLAPLIDAPDVLVWAAADAPGAVQGFSVVPLYPGATQLLERSPETYELMTLVDALRLGDHRSRGFARELLSAAFGIPKGASG